jgi:hypothetical protein
MFGREPCAPPKGGAWPGVPGAPPPGGPFSPCCFKQERCLALIWIVPPAGPAAAAVVDELLEPPEPPHPATAMANATGAMLN